jgi:hypothetical protein
MGVAVSYASDIICSSQVQGSLARCWQLRAEDTLITAAVKRLKMSIVFNHTVRSYLILLK